MLVLVLAADPSLQIALASMSGDLDLRSIPDVERVALNADLASVVVIDLGSTARSFEATRALSNAGVETPCVVVAREPVEPSGDRARVVSRPFTLAELRDAIDAAAGEGEASAARADVLREAEEELHALAVDEDDVEPEPVEPEPEPVEPEPEPVEPEPEPEPVEAFTPEQPPPAPEEAGTVLRMPPHPTAAPWRRRRMKRVSERTVAPRPSGDPVDVRLREALLAANGLQRVLHELPMLGDPSGVAEALVGEIVERLGAHTAVVYAPPDDGRFAVIAGHGLSRVEAGLHVAVDHPVMQEVAFERRALCVFPVDLARGAFAGLAGAHVEAFMAAPLDLGDEGVAVVTAGGDSFSERDLDVLFRLAAEAASSLALAQALARVRRGAR